MKKFTNLKEAIKEEAVTNLNKTIENIKDTKSFTMGSFLTKLRKEQLKKGIITREEAESIAIKKATKESEKKLQKELERIELIENGKELNQLTITVEWKKSSTWGSNPTAKLSGDTYYTGSSVSGCGYDKESTAISEVLKNSVPFMKELYSLKEDNIDKRNNEIFGYGSGYGILPYFEGGVGTGCLYKICESMGYKFKKVSSGNMFDVYTITKSEGTL